MNITLRVDDLRLGVLRTALHRYAGIDPGAAAEAAWALDREITEAYQKAGEAEYENITSGRRVALVRQAHDWAARRADKRDLSDFGPGIEDELAVAYQAGALYGKTGEPADDPDAAIIANLIALNEIVAELTSGGPVRDVTMAEAPGRLAACNRRLTEEL
jgi:hypothetical protein